MFANVAAASTMHELVNVARSDQLVQFFPLLVFRARACVIVCFRSFFFGASSYSLSTDRRSNGTKRCGDHSI